MVLRPRLYKGTEQDIAVAPQSNVSATIARGGLSRLRTATRLDEPLVAPLKAGQRVGEMQILDGKTVIRRVPLVVTTEAPMGGVWPRLRDTIALWFR
jgi:D-alanyl-D-alanine carboxypeptidase (penicillin-binding protein 5/6)